MGLSINDYSADALTGKVYSKYSNLAVDTNATEDSASSYLDFDGYLKLLTAQMSNQDFNNSMSDSEFIQQMASYSMMEAISQLSQQTTASYNASLIGKAVTVSDGTSAPDTGIVESVTITDGKSQILVNGNLYSASAITDIVDGETYSNLNRFTGRDVELKDGDGVITGTVKGVFVKSGAAFVVLDDGNTYGMTAITKVIPLESEEDENESDTAEAAEITASAAAYANASAAEKAGVTMASESFKTLMKMLDDTDDELRDGVVDIPVSAAASSALSDEEFLAMIPKPFSFDTSSMVSSADSNSALREEVLNDSVNSAAIQAAGSASRSTASAEARSAYDKGEVNGTLSVEESSSEAQSFEQYYINNAIYGNGAIPTSTRKFADEYPLEAAYADAANSIMSDIRFIHNTDIVDNIDTSRVIAVTSDGRQVTDLGWCGIGRLGEVVTFADGTQRVEITSKNGNNCHLFTSGRYTISELLDPKNHTRDFWLNGATVSERSIIHFADDPSPAELAERKQFLNFVLSNYSYV